ncbi:MAG: Tetracycline resistance protein class [Bacteroidota bacterium]|jgi:DHA1 family tetracycline resistance protein-like MFS transporter
MKNKNAAIGFIFVTLLIDVIGFGIIIPVFPRLLSQMENIPINEASKLGGVLLFAFSIAQFLFSPIMGNLSDKYGRRPILLFSLLGFGLDYLIMAFAPSYNWLIVGRIIAGMTGASFTTASAYIADISSPEDRAKNFGMIGAAFGMGFIIGPMLGGLSAKFGLRVPFYLASGLSLLNFLYGLFILPESLSKENRRAFEWKKANPIGTLIQLSKYKNILGLLIAFIFLALGSHAVQSNWSYFTIYRFKWSEDMVGYSLGLVGVLVGLVQGVLIKYINPKLGNEKSIYLGFGLYALGMFLFAFATQTWMMFVFLVPYCLGGISGPALQAMMAGEVPPTHQGELQGGLTSLMSATSIVGPIMMTSTFYYFTLDKAPVNFPGAPFILGGSLMLISSLITYWDLHWQRRNK